MLLVKRLHGYRDSAKQNNASKLFKYVKWVDVS